MNELKKHLPWADACRVIAIFGVILIHTSAVVVQDYSTLPLGHFLSGVFLESLVRVSVPVFVMLSGALLLPGENIKAAIVPRILKVTIPLVFWSFVYVEWVNYWGHIELDVIGTIKRIFREPVMYHLWFAYMIIGLYLLLPLLKVIFSALLADRKLALYLFFLWFIANSVALFVSLPILNHIQLQGLIGYSGYFLLGGILSRSERARNVSNRIWLLVFIAATGVAFFGTWYLTNIQGTPHEWVFMYFSPNVVFGSIAAFMLFLSYRPRPFAAKIFYQLSTLCFPIYFMHLIAMDVVKGGLLGFSVGPYTVHPLLGVLFWALSTFGVCAAVAALIKLIPGAGKIIG